ncbi:HD domain-containing protein [Xylanibacillus composti]|uniref:5'-deoxynucleotidase n=2 Tax=Xylanibacillus composti TaxID=1572762 RepID=A0A8J4H362_9BACL|nr:HD domain-containing protein [Xylanibacillus composti]MDT9725649.1 HD domain-containing protein [Xylanibacillus composti]GIQ67743.1 phosphohydrolase [Xylanibacillus composti]
MDLLFPYPAHERLGKQLAFIMETDKLKTILRQSYISDGTRRENDAEHTWGLTLMAITLAEHANMPELDLLRVLKMLIVHDLVEIDAGDTFAYDTAGHADKVERETAAAKRLFGMLPEDQSEAFFALWREFEDRQTPEARFAAAVDRLHPMLLNYQTGGKAWKTHQVHAGMVRERNRSIADGSVALFQYALELIRQAVADGRLLDEPQPGGE